MNITCYIHVLLHITPFMFRCYIIFRETIELFSQELRTSGNVIT
jgi:hypothetical protein